MDCLIEKVQGLLDDEEPGEGTSGVTVVQGLESSATFVQAVLNRRVY